MRQPTLPRFALVEHDPGDGPPSRRRIVQIASVATLVGLVTFLLIQGLLAAHNIEVVRDALERGLLVGARTDQLSPLMPLLGGGVGYLVLALVGSLIASRGHRVLFMLPAIGFLFVGAVLGPLHHPDVIGAEWSVECYSMSSTCAGPWFAHPWLGPILDLGLVLVPGWALARSVVPRRWPGRADSAATAAILVILAIVSTAGWAMTVIERHTELRALVAVAFLGLALGVAGPWWPWVHAIFAAFAVGVFGWLLFWIAWPYPGTPVPGYTILDDVPYMLARTWPVALIGIIASAWQPLAWAIRKLQDRPVTLVIAVNVLNIVDAVMTLFAVNSGGAYESNPFVRVAGLPVKVVLVGALTFLLFRRRPSALVWPFAALLWVACYHVAGVFVNGWR